MSDDNLLTEDRMPVTEHLDELRKRILVSSLAILAGFLVSFAFSEEILRFISRPVKAQLVFLSPTEAFWTNMKVGFFAGLFLTLPVILYQVWRFVAPGLHRQERKYALPFTIVAALFFYGGLAFCGMLILPFAIGFLMTYKTTDLKPMLSVGLYVDFCVKFLLAFGIIFELPLVITVLSRMGLITPQFLAKNRKYAVLLAFVVAAILTPTPDIFNQCLMAIPLYILYEIGIVAARLTGRRRKEISEESEDSAG